MQLYFIRVISLIAIALVYMLFDVLNKRNVPSIFAYLTLGYGFLLTILYFDLSTILISIAVSAVILGIGYIVYKIGQLGAADVIEFATVSLIMPMQQIPLIISHVNQLNFPFILSLLINTGIVALIIVPLYYIPKAVSKLKRPISSFVTKQSIIMASSLAIAYVVFISFIVIVIGFNYVAIVILSLMMASSFLVIMFSTPIMLSMIEYVSVDRFDEGDIIAVNLMKKRSIDSIKRKVKDFDRLITSKTIKEMKSKKIKGKLPVYKEAMPFASAIFIALILTILIGNILLFIIEI